ncbi:MAG: hypothetical protein K2M60_06200 [Lachnospiraceae bacterium]|nr:hypothetical protein [Lachnospiraceae bacterium]MDE6252593.1 hypothetical protein [Lachnospiraceae bacterium]
MESRLDFIILSILREQKALSHLTGITLREMNLEELGYKNNTAQKRITMLKSNGKIGQGIKDGHQNTYYVTSDGLELINEEKKGDV